MFTKTILSTYYDEILYLCVNWKLRFLAPIYWKQSYEYITSEKISSNIFTNNNIGFICIFLETQTKISTSSLKRFYSIAATILFVYEFIACEIRFITKDDWFFHHNVLTTNWRNFCVYYGSCVNLFSRFPSAKIPLKCL